MFRSIAPAINLKTKRKYYYSGFFRSFSLASLTSGYLWYSSFTAYASNNNSERGNTARGLFVFICVELRALLISGSLSRMRKVRSCKVEILIYAWNARKNSLFAKLSQKRIRWPYFFYCKNLFSSKSGMHVQNCKKICGVEFFKLGYFIIFLI